MFKLVNNGIARMVFLLILLNSSHVLALGDRALHHGTNQKFTRFVFDNHLSIEYDIVESLPINSLLHNQAHPGDLAQSGQPKLRSRSDVINEVKQRYQAKVLKISLNEQRGIYNVRVLMPTGKVRNLRINAKR